MKSVQIPPTSVIKQQLGIDPNGTVQWFFVNTCYRHMDKYVPMDTGNLRTNISMTNNMIIYESPYASYQYHGVREDNTHKINPENYTSPGTGPYWDERMVSAEMSDIEKEIQDFIRR